MKRILFIYIMGFSLLSWALLTIYAAVFFYWVTRNKFLAKFGITKKEIIYLLFIKWIVCALYSSYNLHTISDTCLFYQFTIEDTPKFLKNPLGYLKLIFQKDGNEFDNLFASNGSYWNYLKGYLIVFKMILINLISDNNYYTHQFFMSALSFISSCYLFKVFQKIYPNRTINLLISFLTPATIFFTSGVHKDVWMFFGIVITLYGIISYNTENKLSSVFKILLGFCLMFIYRNFFFLAFIPAFIAYVMANKLNFNLRFIYFIVYLIATLFFFNAKHISEKLNFAQKIVDRRQEFVDLNTAGSYLNNSPLYANWQNYFANLPEAINHALMRPYVNEIKKEEHLFMFLENLMLCGGFILMLLFYKPRTSLNLNFEYMLIFFSLISILFIGYSIPIFGAIVRYRCIFMPFLLNAIFQRIKIWQTN